MHCSPPILRLQRAFSAALGRALAALAQTRATGMRTGSKLRWLAGLVVAVVLVVPTSAGATGTLDQSQTTYSNGSVSATGAQEIAQTFTAGVSGSLDHVELNLSAAGRVSDLAVQIETTTVRGLPSGVVLASATVPAGSVPSSNAWVTVPLSAPAPSSAGTQYAIVLSAPTTVCRSDLFPSPSALSECFYRWNAGNSGFEGPYAAGGPLLSRDSGASWSSASSYDDLMFQTFVTAADATAPTTTIKLDPASADGGGGWYVSSPRATVGAADEAGGSGVSETRCVLDPASVPASFDDLKAGCAHTGAGAEVTSDGEHVLYAASKDEAGNAATPVSRAFKLDTKAPTVTCATAPSLRLNQADATVTASVSDATSGAAQGQVSAAADTTSVGAKTATVTGKDTAGNQATTACAYTVGYGFGGFSQPVDNLDADGNPVLNVAKAGRAIPLKWRLTDATGAPVTTLTGAQITVAGISCSQDTTLDQIEETAAGASGLQNLGDGNYQLNWKSPTSYAGSCKRLRLDLGEGSYHTADFKFTT